VFGKGSSSALKLSEAARDVCDLVWVVDSDELDDAVMLRLLGKLGATLDTAGLSDDAAAAALRRMRPDGIVAYADAQIATASALAGRLGLDYHDGAVAARLLDKSTQRQALRAGGLPVPRCVEVPPAPTPDEVRALAASFEFPVVLKPRHGAASRDTVLVSDASELGEVLARPSTGGGDAAMVVEEYMVGATPPPSANFADYLSVESVVVSGTIQHVAVTGRVPQVEPFREVGLVIPTDFEPDVVDEVLALASQALVALGVRTGCFHTEIKATTDGLRVIEVNGRLGGFVPETLALAAPGVNLYEISQRVALGEQLDVTGVVPGDRVGYVVVAQPPLSAQRVAAVDGLDRLAEYPGVSDVFLSRQPGDAVDWRKGSHEYVFSVLGAAPDYDGVLALQKFIETEVSITYA